VEAVDIAVDGSVVELYPGFERYMREVWRVIDGIGPAGEKMIKMGVAKDGSSIGAAIIALIVANGRASHTKTP
jgi:hexokinase